MPFNPSTEQLWHEVQAALEETRQHTEPAADIWRRTTGRWYRKDRGSDVEPDPENFGYSFQSNMLPRMAIANPGVKVDAARVIGHKTVAQAMEDGLEAWVRDVDLVAMTDPVHADFLAIRGVLMHSLEEDTRWSRGQVTPKIERIPPWRFFQDSLAESRDQDEFRGHWYYADFEELMANPDVRDEAKQRLSPGAGDTPNDEKNRPHGGRSSAQQLGRRRIKCYSVWIRHSNTIRVIAQGAETVELFAERRYYGPATGPYTLYDAYPVDGSPWPLSPMIAVEDQVRDLNIHARAMGRAAARRRSIGLVEANNPDLGQKLTDAEDGEILPAKGITGQHVILEVGGATEQQYTHTEYLRQRLDRVSGMTATVQGAVGDADTATEAKIADDSLEGRVKYLKRKVLKATETVLYKVAWFLFHTEGVVIPVNRRDPYSGEQVEGLFFGGPTPDDRQATWDDFDLRIMPYTMQRESEQVMQQRMLGFFQVFMQVMEVAPQMPWVRWMNVLRDIGQAFEVDKADEWAIPEIFGAMSQPELAPPSMAMGGGQQPGGGNPQPGGSSARAGKPQGGGGMRPMSPGQGAQNPGPAGQGPQMGGQNRMNRGGQATGPRPQQTGQAA